jgi:hypothetical protein
VFVPAPVLQPQRQSCQFNPAVRRWSELLLLLLLMLLERLYQPCNLLQLV